MSNVYEKKIRPKKISNYLVHIYKRVLNRLQRVRWIHLMPNFNFRQAFSFGRQSSQLAGHFILHYRGLKRTTEPTHEIEKRWR